MRTLVATTMALFVVVAPAGAAEKGAHIKRPKAGQYIGETEKNRELTLEVAGRRARLELQCGATTFTLRHLKLHRTSRGYAFGRHGRRPKVTLEGRFARTGTTAHGRVAIKSKLCDTGGSARWTARHVKRRVQAPRSREYDGETGQSRAITLFVSGRTIELASFAFACGYFDGRTNLNGVALRRTRKGYAFSIKSHGSVTYGGGLPDENAEVDLSGRFNPAATTATGHIRVKSPRCGGTGQVPFMVKAARNG